jgi:hypothetical protein
MSTSKFVPQATTYTLNFQGTDMDGLVVVMKQPSIGEIMGVKRAHDDGDNADDRALETFVRNLVSWNLARPDGSDVPATKEGLLEQSVGFMSTVITAWAQAVSGVSGPLEMPSTSGSPSLEEQIRTATLSPSLAS